MAKKKSGLTGIYPQNIIGSTAEVKIKETKKTIGVFGNMTLHTGGREKRELKLEDGRTIYADPMFPGEDIRMYKEKVLEQMPDINHSKHYTTEGRDVKEVTIEVKE